MALRFLTLVDRRRRRRAFSDSGESSLSAAHLGMQATRASIDAETDPWEGCEVPTMEDDAFDEVTHCSPTCPAGYYHQDAYMPMNPLPTYRDAITPAGGGYPVADQFPSELPRRWSEEVSPRCVKLRETRKLSEGSCVRIRDSPETPHDLTSFRDTDYEDVNSVCDLSMVASPSDVSHVIMTIVNVKAQEAFMTWTFTDTSVKTILVVLHPAVRGSDEQRHDANWKFDDSVLSEDEADENVKEQTWRRTPVRSPGYLSRFASSEPELDKLTFHHHDNVHDFANITLSKRNSCDFLDRVDSPESPHSSKKNRKASLPSSDSRGKQRGGSYKRKLSDNAFFRRLSGAGSVRKVSVSDSPVTRGSTDNCLPNMSQCLPDVTGHLYPVSDCILQDGKPKDYQLWVLSGKEESPYPLIGHEQPYSIKMSHMRDAARGPDDSPIDVDANDNSIRCQLVLRQAKKDPKNTLDEPGIKRNKKSKKSPLINFFKKSMKHDSPPAAPPLGKLFGRSLCEVSEEDAIPKPIMAMLHQLFLSGPYTTGIFRKTANQRCIREMREKLDNGEDVNFEQTPVLSIAGIFKEFLRSLPDCLFLSDMYDSWLDILEIQDNQQRVEKVKKTLEQLPKPHVNLLRYIMCMLYHIEVRSESNSMNASNLAICIGQSLLFLPTSSGTPNQTGTKRVTELIQFIIESSIDVFGEDVTMLFGEAPDTKPRQDSSTDSDSMHSLLSLADNNGPRRDDSSLDSLDRDLYNSEIESSPRLLKSHMSNTNLSRDSGLTLSDTQLYTDDCSEGNEYPRILVGGSPQKHHHQQHFMRSVSQIEEHHHHQKMIPAEMLSRSCGDGTLDLADHAPPVPPPRKSRPRRGAETPPGEQSPPGLPGGLQGVTMRHSQSMSQMSPPGYNSRHPKADMSLEDLDENLVAEEYTEIQRIVHDQDEGSILHKSESGACLFMNDEVVHRGLPEKQQIYVGQDTSPAQPSWGEMSDDSPMRSLPDLSGSYGDIAGSPITSPLGMDLSASYPNVFTNTLVESTEVHHPVVIPDHPPPPYNANHKTVPTPSQKRPTQEGSLEPSPPLPPRPTTLVLQHQQTPLSHHSKESFTSPPSSQHSKQLGGKILHNQFQKDPTILRKVQKGMTPTGADIFPKHMRSMMRHSLQEEEMRKAVQTKEKMPVHKVVSDTQSLQHSESQAECRKIVMQMYKSRSVEKSASDSNILDTFQPSQESTPRKSSDSAIERQRPNKPPSYQEAIKRKSLIQSGALRYEASETELIEQRANNQRARQLYEDSMKRYMEENNEDTRSNTLEDSQSGESSASQGAAEQIYETMMYMPEKSETEAQQPDQQLTESPEKTKWQKDNSIHVCQDRLQDQPQEQDMHIDNRDLPLSNSRQGALLMQSNGINCISHSVHRQQYSHSQDLPLKRDSESHESTPVRSNHSHERTSRENRNNNQNERPKSRSKSRDKRHGHRSSDTRLENSRSKDDREFRYLRSNLSRSKSDSQEHLNKIAHFKELKPLDNNIIEKCKRAKIDSFSRTLAHQSNESPRSRNQSVKNKEWHRQLAEKYNQVFYQPPSVQQKKSVPQYAYIKSTKQEANKNERPKRRWTRPVHPSKDLIINNDVEVRTRKNTPPRTIVKSENDFRNGQQYENSRKNMVAEKENRPAVVSVSEPVAPQTQTECSEFLEHSKDFTMAEPDTISWSVARLRNLYDDSKSEGGSKGPQGPFYSPEHEGSRPPPPPYRHPPAANRTTTIQHSPNEKTNPEAEESYV